jgi:rare lipoprotein A
MKFLLFLFTAIFCFLPFVDAQVGAGGNEKSATLDEVISGGQLKRRTLYGLASYYADKFDGRPTASGEAYDHNKFTAACNQLPLGTWIRVTNLSNNRRVVVRTNDRLHVKMKRLIDLSRSAAELLGYTKRGLTQVKVEVLEKE